MRSVRTHSKIISPSITVDTAAYAAGENIGGKLTLTGIVRIFGGTGALQSLYVRDTSNTKPALIFTIFNSNPTAATLTDNAAAVWSTDVTKIVAQAVVFATDYVSAGGVSIANIPLGGLIIEEIGVSKNMYMAITSVGVTDFVAATDLAVKIGVVQD